MKAFYFTVRKFLRARATFRAAYPKHYTDADPKEIQKLADSLPVEDQSKLYQDISKMNLFLTDEAINELSAILYNEIFLPIQAFEKGLSALLGKIPAACEALTLPMQKQINLDLNLDYVRQFEKNIFTELKKQNDEEIAPEVMRAHLESLQKFEAVLQQEDKTKKVIGGHEAALTSFDLFEQYLRKLTPRLLTCIATIDQALTDQAQLAHHLPEDHDVEGIFRGTLRTKMMEAGDWPFVPGQVVQMALRKAGVRALTQEKQVGEQFATNHLDVYQDIEALKAEFLPAYSAFVESVPLLSPIAQFFRERGEEEEGLAGEMVIDKCVARLHQSWQAETDKTMFSHKAVKHAYQQIKAYYAKRKQDYDDALCALDKGLREAKAGYESWIGQIHELLTIRLPKARELHFERQAVELRFQHVRHITLALQSPQADQSIVDKGFFKRILCVFLYTGRSQQLLVQLQRYAGSYKAEEAGISAFIQSFTEEGKVKNLADLFQIFDEAAANEALVGYKSLIGGNPIGRVSTPKELIHDLRIELGKIIERENQFHTMQRSMEAALQEEEAAFFEPGKQKLNFELTYSEFLKTFKDVFTFPEMIRLRENMVVNFCWPLSEESKFIRMHVALTQMSLTLQAMSQRKVPDGLAARLTVFAGKHYSLGTRKKDQFPFSYSAQALRSRLDACGTHRTETLLGLYKTINTIALADYLSESERLQEMQRIVGAFDYDIRHSRGGKGSNLVKAIEVFMREEWKLDVDQFLEQFSNPSVAELVPKV